MDRDLIWVLVSVTLIAGCVAMIVLMARHRLIKAEKERMETGQAETAPPASIPSAPVAQAPASAMEQRETSMTEARRSGRCMYCNEPAAHPYPQYKRVRSMFDFLFRWLGVKQLDRWRVSLGPSWFWNAREDEVVCTAHQQRIIGLLEEHLAQETRDIARYLNNECQALYEFGVADIHEIVSQEMRVLRDPKGRKAKARAQAAATEGPSKLVDLNAARQKTANGNGA